MHSCGGWPRDCRAGGRHASRPYTRPPNDAVRAYIGANQTAAARVYIAANQTAAGAANETGCDVQAVVDGRQPCVACARSWHAPQTPARCSMRYDGSTSG